MLLQVAEVCAPPRTLRVSPWRHLLLAHLQNARFVSVATLAKIKALRRLMRCLLQYPQDCCLRDSTRNIAPPRTKSPPPKSREILRKSPTSSQKCELAKTARLPPSTEESVQPWRLSPTPAARSPP